MNLYLIVGSALGTDEAQSLSARLSAWHDAMVTHERRLRSGRTSDVCGDECPHADARALWSEAIAIFGPRAHELAFLRSRANAYSRRSKGDGTVRELGADNGDTGHAARTRETPEHRALAVSANAVRVVEL